MFTLVVFFSVSTAPLERAAEHVAEFEIHEALAILERQVASPPHAYDDHVRLYELLGISYGYLGRTENAAAAFDMLLTLDSGYAIGYTLSPKATFEFQRARERAKQRVPPVLGVSWSRGLSVAQEIAVVLEVVADTRGLMRRAAVHWRTQGEARYNRRVVQLAAPGDYRTVLLPPAAPDATTAATVELYVVVLDQENNEVAMVATSQRPREIALTYEESVPVYKRWWLWAGVGVAVAATVAGIFLATNEASTDVGGSVQWE